MTRIFAGLLFLTLPTIGAAQTQAAPACVTIDAELPRDLAAWRGRAAPVGQRVVVGRAVTVPLRPIADVRYAAPPEKPGAAGSFGATVTLQVARAGTYRVALSDPAWVDLVAGSRTIPSSTHGHGPRCSSIRKIVAFPLRAGRHVLQLGGSAKDRIAVLVTPAR